MYLPRAFTHQNEFLAAVKRIPLPPGVLNVEVSLGTDYYGEDCAYFQITLAPNDDREAQFKLRRNVRFIIQDELSPLEEWGVGSDFKYIVDRSHKPEPALA